MHKYGSTQTGTFGKRFTGIFTPQQQAQLEQFLVMVDDSTSNQIAVVTVNDLGGYDKAQFTTELGQKWKVGNEKFDNGIVLIKPKKAINPEKFYCSRLRIGKCHTGCYYETNNRTNHNSVF